MQTTLNDLKAPLDWGYSDPNPFTSTEYDDYVMFGGMDSCVPDDARVRTVILSLVIDQPGETPYPLRD